MMKKRTEIDEEPQGKTERLPWQTPLVRSHPARESEVGPLTAADGNFTTS